MRASSPLLGGIRTSEWLPLSYFWVLAAVTPRFHDRPGADSRTLAIAIAVTAIIFVLHFGESRGSAYPWSVVRDWVPLAFTLAAYRELDLFTPRSYSLRLETQWATIDHILLQDWGLRSAIESLVPILPSYLELCYLFTSAVAAIGIVVLYTNHRRGRVNQFLSVYLLGTLLAYALIPWFPTEPPRFAFPQLDAPAAGGLIRFLNVAVLARSGIHSGVFPSAHVSSTFSAAWGMFFALAEKKWVGWLFLIYACSVMVATVYGRYHFATDAVAGFVVSLVPVLIHFLRKRF